MRSRALRLAAAAFAILLSPLPAFAMTGDVTNDGVLDLRDALSLCQFLSGTLPSLPAPRNGDVNFDGQLDTADLDLMLLSLVGAPLPTAPLTATPTSLSFGDVQVGSDASLDVRLTNGGATDISIQSIALGVGTSGEFTIVSAPPTPYTLPAGAYVVVTVRYAPTGTGGDTGSVVALSTGGDVTVGLTGTGVSPSLSVSPLTLDFGDLVVGDEATDQVAVANAGTSPLDVSSIAPGPGTSADFTLVSAPATPFTLAPGQMQTFSVRYAPSQGGNDTGTIEILSTGGTASVTLMGRGLAPALDVSPLSLPFGNVLVGHTTKLTTVVTNTGSAAMQVTGVALSLGSSADFTLSPLPATPFTVPAGGTQAVEVSYTPSGVGMDSGSIEIHTDAGDASVSLTGAGVTPAIDVSPQSLLFGNVLLGQTPSLPVQILNAGTADLTVMSIAFAPGGAAAYSLQNVPLLPAVIPPGGSVMVDVVYAPVVVSSDTATLQIGSDDPVTPAVEVHASGNGVSPALLVQPNTLSFSNVRAGHADDQSFTITNSGGSDLTVNTLALSPSSSADFSLVTPPPTPFTLAPSDFRSVTVRYAPGTAGADSGTVDIDTTGGPAQVILSANAIAPEIDVTPAALPFGNVLVGSPSSLQVTIKNVGSDTLNVSGIALGGTTAEIVLSGVPPLPAMLSPGGSIVLSVTYTPAQPGSDSDTLTITSDDDDEPSVMVGVTGTGVAPVLEATPASLAFGDVTVAASRMLSITLKNTGTADLHVTSVGAGAGTSTDFTIGAPATMLLPPGAMTSVSVTYMPSDLGDDTGSVEIATDGGNASISLTGRGVLTVTVASLSLSRTTVSLAEGECIQLHAIAGFTNGTFADVTAAATWSSADPNVAAAGSTGLVEGRLAGQTMVTADYSGFMATADVTVVPAGTLKLALPCGEVAPAAAFTAELTVDTGSSPLGSYAIEIVYDPAVVKITGITGGASPEFGAAPAFNPVTFTSGTTLIASYQNSSLVSPSGVVSVAHVSFEVIGAPGASGAVSLHAMTLSATDLSAIAWTNVPGHVTVTP